MGDQLDPANPFQWETIRLNLPAASDYDPSMPRVLLLRSDGELATRKATFVDDIHGAGRGKEQESTKPAVRTLTSKMNYHGNQEAARKRRHATLTPGAWNGVLIHCDQPHPIKSTTASKWRRGADALNWLWEQFGLSLCTIDPIAYVKSLPDWNVSVDTAELRRIAGLWVHLTEVYSEGRCFMKGFYNAMEAFHANRDDDGWRLAVWEDEVVALETNDATRAFAANGYPDRTRVTYELILHVDALRRLFTGSVPRVVQLRPTDMTKLRYSVGDASAEGFAVAVQYPLLVVEERDGLWLEEYSAKSSNLREALNIANHLKHDITQGKHDGCEIWQATDNAVWSAVCNKGMSSARHLFDLLVELKQLAHQHNVFWRCFHISGARMIATGIDGLSRGDRDSGIALGYDIRTFLPLDKSAFDVSGETLMTWCKGWMGEDFSTPLLPADWFTTGHQPGIHIWAPPPAAALVALKELAKARHKRPYSATHVIVVPRLLYQEEWRKRFEKEVDVWFALDPGGDAWPFPCYEPLMVGISFPLYRTYPWLIRLERDKVVEFGRTMCKMSKESHLQVRHHLRELWSDPRAFFSL